MSILNFYIERDRAIVAVDTMAGAWCGERGEVSKIFPFAHLNCVLAGRGHVGMLAITAGIAVQNVYDFDSLRDAMPKILQAAFSLFKGSPHHARVAIADQTLDAQEIALIGWSPFRQSMMGVHYVQSQQAVGFGEREVSGFCLSPGKDAFPGGAFPELVPSSREAMASIARIQAQAIRASFPALAVGGRLLVAELGSQSLSITTACELADSRPSPDQAVQSVTHE